MSKQFLSVSSLFVLFGLGCSLSPAIAATSERATPDRSQGSFEISQLNLPAPDSSSPDSTAGGGKRGGCLNREARTLFVPVMPNNQANTLSSAPSLWLNLPENQAVRAEFSIFKQTSKEESSLVNYQEINNLDGQSGLLRIDVPENTLVAGTSYFWNLTLACDAIDRSADIDLWGSIDHIDTSKLSIRNDAAVMQSLAATLMGQNSYFSMEKAEATELGVALKTTPDLKTLSMVEKRLRDHFLGLQNDYVKLTQSIRKLQESPNVNAAEMASLKAQRNGMVLELAQLSAYFDVWGDAVNFLASYRAENPDEWQSLLKIIAPTDNPETEMNEYQMVIKALSTAPNFQGS